MSSLVIFSLWGCISEKESSSDTEQIEEVPQWVDISEDVEQIRTDFNLPALGGVHIQDGAIVKLGTTGLRSSSSEVEVTDKDKWHLGSCTKAMTATLVATYIDDGLLTWDSTLKELFPDITMHPSYEEVTVAMLLSHYGGTWSSLVSHSSTWQAMWEEGDVVEQRQQMVVDVLSEEPEVQPNTTFLYSNAGYIIVGSALESLTGQSWEELMKEKIFAPLHMDSCGFGGQDPQAELAHPWGHNENGVPLHPVDDFSDNPPALGPAGTGKTFLAVAVGLTMLLEKKIDRIILSRPAVEAGERLGFLPGDMKEKVDPYLRPLYDSLYDLFDFEKIQRMIEIGDIEIAPLAFMRGRTLKNSFAILDEAQNATDTQIKMFLTRLGENSKIVVNGDPTQIDLPNKSMSGLVRSKELLGHLNEISIVNFDHSDVVRHPLVSKIVKAYSKND